MTHGLPPGALPVDWYRKADLSADRAAFLVLRDAAPVVRMIGRVAGGSRAIAARIPAGSLIEQAGEIGKVTGELKTGGIKKPMFFRGTGEQAGSEAPEGESPGPQNPA